MSSRTRDRRTDHTQRPDSRDRASQHRAVRRTARQALRTDDPDELVVPVAVRTPSKLEARDRRDPAASHRFKVWKTRFWKRRGNLRLSRELQAAALLAD